MTAFTTTAPCASTELVHFRHRIGESGMELILKESVRVNLVLEDRKQDAEDRKNRRDGRVRRQDKEQTAFSDSTVQEKNVTFPTDSKLLNKVIVYCRKVSSGAGTDVRQSYVREIKRLKLTQREKGAESRPQDAHDSRKARA